jgi:uncharacterized protein (DUF4415 family)
MATVKVSLNEWEKPSVEALSRIAALDGLEPNTSDIPEASSEELREISRKVREKRKKQMFSLRLETATIEWWQRLGEGYTGIMARLLSEARQHPEWIKACL